MCDWFACQYYDEVSWELDLDYFEHWVYYFYWGWSLSLDEKWGQVPYFYLLSRWCKHVATFDKDDLSYFHGMATYFLE